MAMLFKAMSSVSLSRFFTANCTPRSVFFRLPSVYNFFSSILGINMATPLANVELGMRNDEFGLRSFSFRIPSSEFRLHLQIYLSTHTPSTT